MALHEPQLRETRLSSIPLSGLAIGILSLRELAAQTTQLAYAVESRTDRRIGSRRRQPLAGLMRFIHCAVPVTVELQDLGSTHAAMTAIRSDVRLNGAPLF